MLIEAGLALSSELDLDSVLERIVELALGITGARYGALGVLGEDAPRIERFITQGVTDEERAAIGHLPVGHGILGLLIEERRPMRIPEIGADPRSAGFPPNHPPMHSFLGAPVKALGQVFGNIYLTEKQGAPEFTDDDEAALVVLATQAGVAIENARLYDEMRRAHEELARLELLEERERIAKELHDGVIQALFAVGMGLQGTAAMANDPEIARRIENATEEVDRAIRDLRNYIFGLRPGILADRQLDQALQQLALEFQERTDVLTIIDVDGSVAAELASRAADVVQLVREGAVERRPPRPGHVVPYHAAALERRRRTRDRRRRSRVRPLVAVLGDGHAEPARTGDLAGRRAHDPQRRRRGHDDQGSTPPLGGHDRWVVGG